MVRPSRTFRTPPKAPIYYISVSSIAPDSFNSFSMSVPIAEHEARLSARVPHEVREAAERAAAVRGLSLSEWLRQTITHAAQEAPVRRPARLPRRPGT